MGRTLQCRLFAALLPAGAALADQPVVTFEQQIKPIFERHCVSCHAGWFPKGGLRLDSREHVLEGGKQGAAVIPGKPDKGWLINLVKPPKRGYSPMPPGPQQLSPEEIRLLEVWIAQGAR